MAAARRLLVGLIFCTCLAYGNAFAQQAPAGDQAPAQMSAEELDELVATLEDETERQRLIRQLKALSEARRAAEEPVQPSLPESLGASIMAGLGDQVDRIGAQLSEAGEVLLDLPKIAAFLSEQAQDPATRQRWLEILGKLALVLAAGLVAEWLVGRLLRRPRHLLEAREVTGLVARMVLQVGRTLLDVVAIAAFAAAAYGVLPLTEPRPETRLVAIAIVNANVLVRAVMALARMLFVPSNAGLRLIRVSDETAHYLVIWVRRVAVVAIYGYVIAEAALLLGLPSGAYATFAKAAGLLVAAMLIMFVMQNRAPVAAWLRGEPPAAGEAGSMAGLRRLFSEIWHVVAILLLIAAFGVWALEVEGGFAFLIRAAAITLAVIVITKVVIGALHTTARRGFRLTDDLKTRFPGLEQRANRYLSGMQRGLDIVIYVVAGLVLLDAWGVSVFAWLASDAGRFLTSRLATVVFILLGAAVVWEIVSTVVERYLEERDSAGGAVQRSARVRTLLPLMRNAVRVVLAVIVALTILSELGINIAPLLAGAGVVGLAIGFGAQSLVKDVITGTFILLEDAISVGDVVDLGGHAGVVEGMTIRSIRLRDLSGNVHLVPFGEVSAVLNMTKEFSFAVLDVGVAYREDVDEVIEVLKQIGAEMQADEEFGPLILEPLEVLGLDSFGASSVNIRVRLKTRPIRQWGIKREFNRRMKRRFDELGIEIPFPHQTLYFGVDKEGKAPPARILFEDFGRAVERALPEPAAESPPASEPDETGPARAPSTGRS